MGLFASVPIVKMCTLCPDFSWIKWAFKLTALVQSKLSYVFLESIIFLITFSKYYLFNSYSRLVSLQLRGVFYTLHVLI